MFDFYHNRNILLGQSKPTVVMGSDPDRYFSHLRKIKACSVGGDALSWLKSFTARSFIAHDKNGPFLLLYEEYQMS